MKMLHEFRSSQDRQDQQDRHFPLNYIFSSSKKISLMNFAGLDGPAGPFNERKIILSTDNLIFWAQYKDGSLPTYTEQRHEVPATKGWLS